MSGEPSKWNLSLKPRQWQLSALKLWTAQMRGIVRVVTGGGKTVLAELCMKHFLENYPDGRINIIVPTIALLDQWYVSLIEDLGIATHEIACYSGDSHPATPGTVNIFVLNTARVAAPSIAALYNCLLIVDECHHAATTANSKALHGNYGATLGLSATPEREYDHGLESMLIPRLGKVIFDYDYIQARHDGVIVQFDLINVSAELLPDERAQYDRLSKLIAKAAHIMANTSEHQKREHMKRLLQKRAAVACTAVARIPVTLRLLEEHRGQRALVFHERIDMAETICRLLIERHYSAALYHSRMNPVIRRDNLRLYRRGLFDVLVTCRALDEGMNVPETTVAIVSSSTASFRQRVQRLGRVLRPALGKEKATIYTIYTTKVEEERLRNEELNISEAASIQWKRSSFHFNGTHTV
ncbi:MAG: DEAD/DEAH box helicase [Dehalococcoidia bacterium]|jgi:superfamily II DNA or RNA helicase